MNKTNQAPNPGSIKTRISNGEDLHWEDVEGISLLYRLFQYDSSLTFLKSQMKKKAIQIDDILSDLSNGASLMTAAAQNPYPGMFEYLIKNGPSLFLPDNNGKTPFMYAAQHNPNTDILDRFIISGIDLEEQDKSGKTVLIYAAGFNPNPEITQTLIEEGCDIEYQCGPMKFTPLMYAAFGNSCDVAERLLDNGADPAARAADGITMLECAAENRRNPKEMRELILRWVAKYR